MAVQVRKAKSRLDYAHCIQVRTIVFVIGQNVPADREIDEYEDDAVHFLALTGGRPVGAGRWRRYQDTGAKLERLAVLEQARGEGIGKALMKAILKDIAADSRVDFIILGAQDHAIPFYKDFGFTVCGDAYMDGGDIPHHDMRLDIRK